MPPVIIDNMTSTDMVVREGTNVTMVCRATGYPEPYVMWRREDGQEFNCNGESGKSFVHHIDYRKKNYNWRLQLDTYTQQSGSGIYYRLWIMILINSYHHYGNFRQTYSMYMYL